MRTYPEGVVVGRIKAHDPAIWQFVWIVGHGGREGKEMVPR